MLFSRKAKKQQRSRLVQLPAEIRMMILRLLLVHGGPLRARNWYGNKPHPKLPARQRHVARLVRERKEEVACSYDLCPEILATCQTLFNDGHTLLYSSNTLGLQICEGDIDLDTEFGSFSTQCGCGTIECSGGMFVYAIPYVCTKLSDKQASTILNLIKRFDKLHIDVNNQAADFVYDEDDDEFPLVRQVLPEMAAVLRNKIVQVKFINPNRANDTEGVKEQLADISLIRCKEIQILNTEIPASDASAVTAIATSDRPILNLYKMLENLRGYCEAICSVCPYSDDLYEVSNSARRSDTAEFFKLRAELIENLDGQIKQVEKLRNDVFEDGLALHNAGLPVRIQNIDGLGVKSSLEIDDKAAL